MGSGTTSAVIKEGGSLPRLPTFISFGNEIIWVVGGGPSTTHTGGEKSGGYLINMKRTINIIEKHKHIRKGK